MSTDSARPVTGKVSARRAPTYSMTRHGNVQNDRNADDLTIKREANVALVRPNYYGDPLVFRMLPAPLPEDATKFAPYRDRESGQFTDVIRAYPAVRKIGFKQQYTFLMYDPENPIYDSRSNPYKILWDRIYRALKIDKEYPRVRGVRPEEWVTYIERTNGKQPLTKPTTLFFTRGLVFANGDNVFVGAGKAPRGLGDRDMAQCIQLPVSAGGILWDNMQAMSEGYEGPEHVWEKSMAYGDLVHPKFGRFISIVGKKGGNTAAADVDDYSVGSSSKEQGGGRTGGGFGEGYKVSIDPFLILQGRVTKVPAALKPEAIPLIVRRNFFFDDVIRFLSHDEICVVCAQACKEKPHILQWAWEDHPEFFNDDVQKILKDAKTMPAAKSRDEQRSELEEWADDALGDDSDAKDKHEAAVVPGDDYDAYDEATPAPAVSTDDVADAMDGAIDPEAPFDDTVGNPTSANVAGYDDDDYADEKEEPTDSDPDEADLAKAASAGYEDIGDDQTQADVDVDEKTAHATAAMDAARAAAKRSAKRFAK